MFVNVPFMLDGALARFRQPSRGSGDRRTVCKFRLILAERFRKFTRKQSFELREDQQWMAVTTRAGEYRTP